MDERVRIDDDDYISLTDMWKASGGDGKDQVQKFLINETTKNFISTLDSNTGIRSLRIQRGGSKPGTWAHKLVAYKYASWISPEFEIGTYGVLDKYFSGELVQGPFHQLHDHLKRTIESEDKGSFHGKGLSDRKKEKKELHDEGIKLLEISQRKLF